MNKIIIIGNVGRDADCMPVGSTDVSKFSVATSETYIDKQGQKVTNTEWHNVTCWGGLAKVAYRFAKKGTQIAIEGKMHYGMYEKDGIKRYTSEVVASDIQLLGAKREEAQPSEPPASAPQLPAEGNDDLPF